MSRARRHPTVDGPTPDRAAPGGGAPSAETFDCQRCGACCKNPPENVAQGFVHYVEVSPTDAILRRVDLVKKHVTPDAEGTPHLRLASDGRCLALAGALGKSVRCGIYHHRPTPCRQVEAGSDLCRWYRRIHGLSAGG